MVPNGSNVRRTETNRMRPLIKGLLIGCGVVAIFAVLGLAGIGVWMFSGPESGVKLGNEMDQYALDYLATHELLEPGEEILAYYDVTLAMNGTEAAILTPARVLYHKNGSTTSIALKDIDDIRHRKETLIGDIIEIYGVSGQVMKIEIAPLNQGESFQNALLKAWRNANG